MNVRKKLFALIISILPWFHLYGNRQYISVGLDLGAIVNRDDEVIEELSLLFPKLGLYVGYNCFSNDRRLGFHFDGDMFYSNSSENYCVSLSSLLGPSFLIGNANGILIFPGVSLYGAIGGDSEVNRKNDSIALGSAGFGINVLYFNESNFSLGFNFNCYPLSYIHASVSDNYRRRKIDKMQHSYSVGLIVGLTGLLN